MMVLIITMANLWSIDCLSTEKIGQIVICEFKKYGMLLRPDELDS